MRVLLIAFRDASFPIGLAYIAAALRKAGHQVDCRYFEGATELEQVLRDGYDVLGTGGMSLHFNQLKTVASTLCAAGPTLPTPTKLIVGGNVITSEPELIGEALGVDFGVIGQGEETIVELLACLEAGDSPEHVSGIGFPREGRFFLTPPRVPSCDLDALPWPDYAAFGLEQRLESARPTDNHYWDIFDYPREYPLVAARSCPFACTFCYHPAGEKYRQRSVPSIMAELREVVPRYRINIVNLADDLFAHDEDRVREFAVGFQELAATVDWEIRWACQMRVDRLSPSLLDTMKASGCYLISYGFESYSPTVLASMRKHITPEQIHAAVHETLDRRISIQANFIFGDPAETLETAGETFRFWREHWDAGIGIGFVQVYPDSALYRYCLSQGVITDRLDHIANRIFNVLNMTNLSATDFAKLTRMVTSASRQGGVAVMPFRRSPGTMSVRCPYCRGVSEYRNCVLEPFFARIMFCRQCRKRLLICSRLGYLAMLPAVAGARDGLQRRGFRPARWLRQLATAMGKEQRNPVLRALLLPLQRLLFKLT